MEAKNPRADQSARVSEGSVQTSRDPTSSSPPRQEEQPQRKDALKDDPSLDYAVKTFLPDAEGEELHQRKRLLKAREFASMKMATSNSPAARWWAAEANHIAAEFVYDPHQTPARLQMAADTCHGLMQAVLGADILDLGGDPI